MIDAAVVGQQYVSGEPALLLFNMAHIVGTVVTGCIIYLSLGTKIDYHSSVYYVLGVLAILLFLFGWGGQNFTWPVPGFLWGIGIILVTFCFGACFGWLVPFSAAAMIRRPAKGEK